MLKQPIGIKQLVYLFVFFIINNGFVRSRSKSPEKKNFKPRVKRSKYVCMNFL